MTKFSSKRVILSYTNWCRPPTLNLHSYPETRLKTFIDSIMIRIVYRRNKSFPVPTKLFSPLQEWSNLKWNHQSSTFEFAFEYVYMYRVSRGNSCWIVEYNFFRSTYKAKILQVLLYYYILLYFFIYVFHLCNRILVNFKRKVSIYLTYKRIAKREIIIFKFY